MGSHKTRSHSESCISKASISKRKKCRVTAEVEVQPLNNLSWEDSLIKKICIAHAETVGRCSQLNNIEVNVLSWGEGPISNPIFCIRLCHFGILNLPPLIRDRAQSLMSKKKVKSMTQGGGGSRPLVLL